MMQGFLREAAMVVGLVAMMGMSATVIAGPSRAAPGIAGTWVFEANGVKLIMALNPDGSGSFNDVPMGWKVAGTTLTLSMGGEASDYQAVVSGDNLELSGGDLPGPATFRRQGGSAPSAPTPTPTPTPAAPSKAGNPIVGTWAYTAGGTTVLLDLAGDGSGTFNGVGLSWRYSGSTLTVTAQNGQAMSYQAEVQGDTLQLAGGDLPGPLAMVRRGKPGAGAPTARTAPAATGIVGTWLYAAGDVRYTLELMGDGNGKLNGGPFTWKHAGSTLTVSGPDGNSMAYNAVLQGDNLEISGGNLPGPATLHRQGSPAAAESSSAPAGLAGVYSCTESSVDPSIAIIYTQYVTLYPDGSVAYSKTEGGASVNQVTQNLQRFRSWHQGGPVAGNAGRWESDGSTIVVRWRYWNNLVSRGRVDVASGRFQLSGMGVLEEGATLTFKRE